MANPFVRVGGFFGRFFGNTISESAAYGIGGALREPLHPLLQELTNLTWETSTAAGVGKPLDVGEAAGIVAEAVELDAWGRGQAAQSGYTSEVFEAVLGQALNAPGLGPLYELWRRDLISDADFAHGLRKAKLETRWDAALKGLRETLLSSEELANLQQQGFVSPDRANSEGGLQGVTPERQQLRFEASGLPPGAATAQEYLNRGLIDDATFAEMIREGHTKTKYTDVLRRGAQFVLSPINYVEGRLRGWLTDAEMYAGTALHGVTQADTDLLFKIHGRPISFRQAFIGVRRGGTLDGPIGDIDPAFLASLRRSNIQPPFYNLAWAQRYTYPSAFVLRSLTQSGEITAARAEEVLLFEGWEPGFAKQVAEAWAGGGGTTADPHLAKAQTQLWTTTHRSYIAEEIDDAQASAALPAAGVAAATIPQVLATWQTEKGLIRKQLSPADLRKAYRKQDLNVATGAAWTREDVIARLIELGYDQEDAENYLNIG